MCWIMKAYQIFHLNLHERTQKEMSLNDSYFREEEVGGLGVRVHSEVTKIDSVNLKKLVQILV